MRELVAFILGALCGGVVGFAIGAVLYTPDGRIRRPRKIVLEHVDHFTGQVISTRELQSAKETAWN